MRRATRASSTGAQGFGVGVDLGFLRRDKKYTHFRPKFIYYATYLSEKIGYARYITIYPASREAPRESASIRYFAGSSAGATTSSATARHSRSSCARIRSCSRPQQAVDPILPARRVRNHVRARSCGPLMHAAFDMDPTEYDYTVFRITTEISKQVFPLSLDLDHPGFPKRPRQAVADRGGNDCGEGSRRCGRAHATN